jgi:hypothetical protein
LGKGITAFLRDAIDCYMSDPDVACAHLYSAQDELRIEKGGKVLSAEKKAETISSKKARRGLKARLLELDSSSIRNVDKPDTERTDPAHPAFRGEEAPRNFWAERQEAYFEHLLDVVAWKEREERKRHASDAPDGEVEVSRGWVLENWSREEILSVDKCSDWEQIEREYELASRGEPDFELYLLRKHLDWLDSSVGKIESDGPISFRSAIPGHLKLYLYEANWCNLYGLDAASSSLCGAILEEALRMKLNEKGKNVDRDATLGKVIEVASTPDSRFPLPLLLPRARDHARDVMRLRNLTAHGRPEFAERSELDRKASLCLTIELLETLFAPEG